MTEHVKIHGHRQWGWGSRRLMALCLVLMAACESEALARKKGWVTRQDPRLRAREVPTGRTYGQLRQQGPQKELPWVVPRLVSSRQNFTSRSWTMHIPHGIEEGPKEIHCQSVPTFKFYILEEAKLPGCPDFKDGVGFKRMKGLGNAAQHLAELFWYWQLQDHPWRTYDPDEAQLVVVPLFGTMLVRELCGDIGDGIMHVVKAVEAFPRYHLNKGSDFVVLTTDYMAQYHLWQGKINNKPEFVRISRNFIYVSRLSGKFFKLQGLQKHRSPVPLDRCIIPAPKVSYVALDDCKGDMARGLTCPEPKAETTFQEFMQKRDITMMFSGQADPRRAYATRRVLVSQISHLEPPNYIVGIHKLKLRPTPWCRGSPNDWNGCYASKGDPDVYNSVLRRAKISFMIGGDDPTSTRFYDHIVTGNPQLIIAEGFWDMASPFRCKVNYRDMAYWVDERDFQIAAQTNTRGFLKELLRNDAALLRKKWEGQREAAKDLLWHVPGSRVAHNLLEDIYRRCLTTARGNNDIF